MFRVAFIYPGYENLGIEHLSANLKEKGCEVKLFLDPIIFSESGFINNKLLANIFSFRKIILKAIINYRPDIVCFSVITDNYKWACEWARKIKDNISVPIIFGGIHPTAVPKRVIQQPFIDYVCVGEGDEAIVDLVEAIKERRPTISIQNIWAKRNGSIFENQIRPLISNLDALPFPDKDIYYLQFPIFNDGYLISTSRGCPFKCSYCCNNVYHSLYKNMGKLIRRRSIDNILVELRRANVEYRPKFVHFVDEVFNYDSIWLSDFLNRYKKVIGLPFSCYLYPDFVNRLMAKELKRAGCFKIQMGVQVIGEQKRKRVLKRHSSRQRIARAIDLLKNENIYVTCDSIFGFPDEDESEFLELGNFYNSHTPNHCENFWLRYYPKTEISKWAFDNGYIDLEKNDKIENGEFNFGLIKRPEHAHIKSRTKKFMIFLNLYPFIPGRLRLFILEKRFYRFLLSISPVFLLIIIKIFNRPKYDFNTGRTIRRYLYFSFKKFGVCNGILNFVDALINKKPFLNRGG